jgi:hypothetical protein
VLLQANGNPLTSIHVSGAIALTKLFCQVSQLTSLDVSNNTALTWLYCGGNQLTSLDLSNNPALEILYCGGNQLTSLDLSSNSALNNLLCNNNHLTSLNVRNGNNINFIDFRAYQNPYLYCIEVDDSTWSTTNWLMIDSQHYFSNNCVCTILVDVTDTIQCYGDFASIEIVTFGGGGWYNYLLEYYNSALGTWFLLTQQQTHDTATFTMLSANNYRVTVTDTAGGCTAQSLINISQPAILSINSSSFIPVSCFGGNNGTATVNITGGSGGYTYSWSPGGQTTQTSTNLIAGTYTCIVTDANGCFIMPSVTVIQPAILNVTILPSNSNLLASPSGGTPPYSYSWNGPLGFSSANQNITPQTNGQYTVTITDNNGCIYISPGYNVTFIPSSINEISISDILIYPNPSEDLFNIKFISLVSQDLELRILNSIGEIVFVENKNQFIGEYSKQINLVEYPRAIYFLEIETEDGVINKKLILQ